MVCSKITHKIHDDLHSWHATVLVTV